MKITKNFFEKKAWEKNKYVCGIDEVGRGCLAGPVVTAACILPINNKSEFLRDSKVMTKSQREQTFSWIKKNTFYSIAISDHKLIDQLNIYQATKITMHKSLSQLIKIITFPKEKIESVLIDAMPLKNDFFNLNSKFHSFPKGETYSASIAAASIAAKVFRDKLMDKIQNIFPKYHFKENKGYGTIKHREVLKKEGISIIHRRSFMNKIATPKTIGEKQNNLF